MKVVSDVFVLRFSLCAASAELTLIFRALTEASAARLKMFLELLQLTE
jgi:hypothetical protein